MVDCLIELINEPAGGGGRLQATESLEWRHSKGPRGILSASWESAPAASASAAPADVDTEAGGCARPAEAANYQLQWPRR